MEFKSLKKVHEGKFIARYDVTYETADGKDKVYEMISRDKNIQDFDDLRNLEDGKKVDAVVLIMHDETGEKILLNREFRLAAGELVYNFPAGLIEPGEDPAEAAGRELWEETGLTLHHIDDWMYESYSAVGFSNEKNVCAVGTAGGTFAPSTSTYKSGDGRASEKISVCGTNTGILLSLVEIVSQMDGKLQSLMS